jgi:hypothetical protein
MIRDSQQFTMAFVMQQILKSMYGWAGIDINHLESSQIDLLAAGNLLLCEGKQAGPVKKSIKALESLIQLFWGTTEHLAFRLMGQVAFSAQHIMQAYECSDLLLVSRQTDKTKKYFFHLVDTLRFLTSGEQDPEKKFAQLLPHNAAALFASEYKLTPPFIFQVMRCSLPAPHKQSAEEFKETCSAFWQTLQLNLK